MDYCRFLGEHRGNVTRPPKLYWSKVCDQLASDVHPSLLALLDRAASCLEADEIYVEVGRVIGEMTIAALAHNPDVMAYAVDDPRSRIGTRISSRAASRTSLSRTPDELMRDFESWGIADRIWLLPTSIEEFFVELRHMGSTDRIGLFVYTGPCDYRSLLVCLLRVEPYLADRAAIVLAGYEQAGTQQAIADFLNVRLAGCKLDSTAIAEDLPAGVHLLLWDRQAEQSNWPPHVQIYPVDRIVEDPTTSERLAQIDLVRPERLLSMVYDEARFHHAEHRFDRAEVMYQTVLRRDLQHLGAQLNLGFLYYEQGNWDQAIEAFWQTLAHDENKAEAYYGLGLTYAKLGEPAHAIAAYHQALDRQPDHFNALNNLGNLYYDLDHLDRAADLFERAIEAQPQRAGGYLNRARVDLEYHKLEAAIRWYEQGLMRCQPEVERQSWEDLRHSLEVVKRYQIDPCPLYHQLATHATQQTQPRRALRHYHSLYHHQPNPIHARSLIHCHRTLHQHADARTIVIDELSRTPQDVPLNQLAIQIELDLGQFEQAQERAEIAIRQCPNSAKLQLQRVILVPILYESQAQIKRCRADVFAGLSWLEQEIDRSLASMSFVNPENPASFVNPENSVNSESPANLEQHGSGRAKQTDDPGLIAITPSEWLEAIAQQTNFGLSYQGYDDRPFQERYGRLIRRLVCAVYPEFAAVKTQYRHDRILPRHRLKIGYVSSSMGPSRLGELTIGWIEHHDRQQFEIFGYYTQSSCDALTARFRQACDHFRHFPDRDLTTIAQTIANDRLDLLIFTDLGIDPLLGVLAAMRLASVQCTSWSHPITTGLETIDYFLSSVAMETEISDSHYSETLVRLADIGIVFPRPVFPNALPSQPHSNTESPATVAAPVTPSADDVSSPRSSLRQQLGLGITKTLFLCCQSLFKYLPQDDPIWAAIAAGVPDAQLVFIAHPSPQITQRFRQRLERSFAEQGLDFDRLAIILPRLSEADYLRVNQCCDVFLDSFHWSGGVTTLKAIACGLPVVTCAGELMRSRHSAGILQTLGMTETIAVTPVDYIDLAVRLAHDRVWRQQIRDQIMVRQDRLYDNSACVQDLEALAIGQIFPQKQQPLVT